MVVVWLKPSSWIVEVYCRVSHSAFVARVIILQTLESVGMECEGAETVVLVGVDGGEDTRDWEEGGTVGLRMPPLRRQGVADSRTLL